jgi:peptide/nickel transport system substrate-binding protein
MRLQRIAAASLLVCDVLIGIARTDAARRPRYGGELRIDTRATPQDPESLDPGIFSGSVFETLVKLDDRGDPQPWLAVSWTHDKSRKRWVFTPRANVMLQSASPWSPGPIEFADDRPIGEILRDLARPRNAIAIRDADGSITGTGPFRVAMWEPGKSATLAAHDGYWGGRPFLDSIRLTMGRSLREQAIDLEIDGADVIESTLRPRGLSYVSPPAEVLALEFDDRVAPAARQAVALSIDRAAIYSVLLQKTGEISGALLPRWLTGYSFLFPAERNLARAKQLAANATLTFSYDRNDALLRAIGERLAVNAAEAGVVLHPAARGEVQLVTLTVSSRDIRTSLEDIAAMLKLPLSAGSPFEQERALLADFHVVPLFHLPKIWAMSSRVHNWPHLADVWIEVEKK